MTPIRAHHLTAHDMHKSYGSIRALNGASLAVPRGSTLALLGPSGSGKTTLLRIIAGLEPPDSGVVRVDDEVLTDGAAVVPPERRNIGLVFQDGALFPHMTVAENVGYGINDQSRAAKVAAALDMVDLSGFDRRLPHTLSGGQARRVAIARALAPEPRVLLLDEPFGGLDADLRGRIRLDVARLLDEVGITSVFVTHDQEEAFVVGDQVAVMNHGEIIQVGPPAEVYERPATPWVARFVGDANILAAVVEAGIASTAIGRLPVSDGAAGPSQILVRPEQLILEADGPAVVEQVEFYGHDTSYLVSLLGERISVRSIAAPRFHVGDTVRVTYVGAKALAYPATATRVDAAL